MANARQRTATAKQAPPPAAPPTAAMQTYDDLPDTGVSIVRPENSALEAITRSEVSMQLDAAHRWPRNLTRFIEQSTSMVTLNVRIAQSCMYAVPRKEKGVEKMITGPSIRLAEMVTSAWGNMHTGSRVIEIGEREITAQAVAWDLENNSRMTIEAQRSIVGKYGRFSDDMIRVTGMAAISIALRNAIFRVIPRAYVDDIYNAAKACAVGDAKTLVARRDEWLSWLGKKGIGPERIFARLEVAGAADIGLEHLAILIGIGSSLKSGELQLDDAFPPPVGVAPGPVRAKTAALDTLVNTHKAAAPPAAAPAAAPANEVAPPVSLTWPLVQAELVQADGAWQGEDRLPLIMAWTPEQMRLAYDWAAAFNSEVDDDKLPERPAFTVLKLERQPGEDG